MTVILLIQRQSLRHLLYLLYLHAIPSPTNRFLADMHRYKLWLLITLQGLRRCSY